MKALLVLAILTIAASPLSAQDEWAMSGEIRVKSFLVNDEPDLIKRDYSDYDISAFVESGLLARFHFNDSLNLNAYPYFWYSDQNNIARVGMTAELRYGLLEDLEVGFGHHSWHNADKDSPQFGGNQQNWLVTDYNFSDGLHLLPKVFLANTHPIEFKTVYSDNEPSARFELAVKGVFDWQKTHWEISPYAQTGGNKYLYGAKCEISYPLCKNVSLFGDVDYRLIENDGRLMASIGIALKFE
ncbi:MAG: hypothetical protein UY12_C0014G0013 [Parcubacteria group bacterium GW2011_GWA2_47_8b]|nr:MAG: hypothetical protein UY12_C0014G0013 [Parcubacteria group bacterium GW2011_GWA2_47_8b]